MSGIPEDEIPRFSDPLHWLAYFPPLAMRDIAAMGCGVDWRRRYELIYYLSSISQISAVYYKI